MIYGIIIEPTAEQGIREAVRLGHHTAGDELEP